MAGVFLDGVAVAALADDGFFADAPGAEPVAAAFLAGSFNDWTTFTGEAFLVADFVVGAVGAVTVVRRADDAATVARRPAVDDGVDSDTVGGVLGDTRNLS